MFFYAPKEFLLLKQKIIVEKYLVLEISGIKDRGIVGIIR